MIGAAAKDAVSDAMEVQRIVAGSGTSFALGMTFLPRQRREAIRAVYGFCRIIDDIADGDAECGHDPHLRSAALSDWEAEVVRAYGGQPRTAVGAELARAIDRFDLPMAEFLLVLDGMRMDANCIVAPTNEQLLAYVRRVAGAVGILSMHCFGAWRGAPSERFALNLACALQLTNILRDIDEDATVGRLYIPDTVLKAAGLPKDPIAAARHPCLPTARAMLGRRARTAFSSAAIEISNHSRARLMPALLMMGPYERMLSRMEQDWSKPVTRRSTLGKLMDGTRMAARGRC